MVAMGRALWVIWDIMGLFRSPWNDRGTEFSIRRQHAMEANEVESWARHEGGQALHEFQRGHKDMGGAILVGALELQYDIAVIID